MRGECARSVVYRGERYCSLRSSSVTGRSSNGEVADRIIDGRYIVPEYHRSIVKN